MDFGAVINGTVYFNINFSNLEDKCMKFIELKSKLKNELQSVYCLEGNDRFVIKNAIDLIDKKLNLSFPDVNKLLFNDENKYTIENLIEASSSVPFGDSKKLIIIWDCNLKTNDAQKFLDYIKKGGAETTVFVFASTEPGEFVKKIKANAEVVDCNKLDELTLMRFAVANFNKNGVQIQESAVTILIEYCNSSLARIFSEVEKLSTIGKNVITNLEVEQFVVPDREYQIYELTDAISKNDRVKVFDIVETMLNHDKFQIGLLQYLYQSFRKLFYISISKDSDDTLAKYFNVKPYSIKMSRIQASKFTPKQLKKINEQLSELEFNIKSGKANANNAINYAICKILLTKEV